MADDERRAEIEAMARAMDAAKRMAKGIHEIRVYDGRSAWDGAEIARADFLVVENEARVALDRVRDARGDDEGCECGKTPEACWLPPNLCKHPARSPQAEDHSCSSCRTARERANERLEAALLHIINRVSTEDRDDEHKHLFLVGSEAVKHARAEVAASSSRDGSVAVEDVAKLVEAAREAFAYLYHDEPDAARLVLDAALAEFSSASTGDQGT